MDTILVISSKSLTKYTTIDNFLLLIDSYYKNQKLYGMDNITNEEVLDKLDMFQARFEKVY